MEEKADHSIKSDAKNNAILNRVILVPLNKHARIFLHRCVDISYSELLFPKSSEIIRWMEPDNHCRIWQEIELRKLKAEFKANLARCVFILQYGLFKFRRIKLTFVCPAHRLRRAYFRGISIQISCLAFACSFLCQVTRVVGIIKF